MSVCGGCGVELVNLPTGENAVCPAGCAGLQPPVSKPDHAHAVRACRLRQLPGATAIECVVAAHRGEFLTRTVYHLVSDNGESKGLYRRVKRESASLKGPSNDRATLAYDPGLDAAIELVPWKKAERGLFEPIVSTPAAPDD